MYGQEKLIDGIRSFSPAKKKWLDKPFKELPQKVTVSFETGGTGVLDMKDRRAVVWAKILELQSRYKKPVYVEIDQETRTITQLLVPEASLVMSFRDQGSGDVDVYFFTNQVRHYLRRENPAFQEMRSALVQAMENKSAVLVTATRTDYEIIDVRSLPKVPGAENPAPPPPTPPDPPVSMQRAQDLFDLMNSKSCDACTANCGSSPHCIPFKHSDDGCYARAHEMCRLMMAEGEAPEKIWIYGWLHVDTANIHECGIDWGWHVAPTLMVNTPGGTTERYVIDPSLCTAPVPEAAWKALQNDPNADIKYSSWEPFWSYWYLYTPSQWAAQGVDDPTFSKTNNYLELKCTFLQQDCVDYGPPPYACPIEKTCHFILDRSTFSESEIDAMLNASSPNPAVIEAAFYVVVDGFAPEDFGITSASLTGIPNIKPTLLPSPLATQMTAEAVSLDVEDPSHLKRRQRITWTYTVTFSGTNGFGFAGDVASVILSASITSILGPIVTVSANATIYLIKQPNPYEMDGATSWLSTDLRVFQVKSGDSKFGVTMASNASSFITQIISNLNSGNTVGQTFENDISVDQQTSRLELSQTVNGTPVYNFAVAKVRYRSLMASATDVRVFFRLFPWATTTVAYDQTTEYRRHDSPGTVVPLIGINNNLLSSIPCFAAPRIDSSAVSLTTQTDSPNVQTMLPNAGGAEVVNYFGCWLDINQTQPQFPILPSPVDGPYASGRISMYDHVRNEHQCLVAEIAFSPAPIPNGSTPSTSDKLAQRNLAIVQSANPGLDNSRRIPQTFEIRPSKSRVEHDELMIDWGNVPTGSVATLYLPDFDTNAILFLATKKYRTHRMARLDMHTLKLDTGGITYIPIPFRDASFPGMLTVDLPEGVKKGQVFKVVVRQVTGERQSMAMTHVPAPTQKGWRHVVGSFQLTIPVHEKADILPAQQRLLSNLRWIERAIPARDRWSPVFGKYVAQVAQRVEALGGDPRRVAPSASGQWKEAYSRCLLITLVTILLIAAVVAGCGTQAGNVLAIGGIPVVAILAAVVYFWRKRCRPTTCQMLRALLAGSGIGTIILALIAMFGTSTSQLITMLIVFAVVTVVAGIAGWVKRCFRR